MEIRIDDLSGSKTIALLQEHLQDMDQNCPQQSNHALSLEELHQTKITFWTVWSGEELLGCGALKELNPEHGEIKSMRTVLKHRGKGVASKLLEHLLCQARQRGYKRVSLETGTSEFFRPAQRLYAKFGFKPCGPFADYKEDLNSLYMTLEL
jgi:putative acetyltransferase